MVNDEPVALQFWDTPCIGGWTDEETNARQAQRAEVYPLANIVLICFSVPDPSSLNHVKEKVSCMSHASQSPVSDTLST